jgi:transcriptional antiterminator RfaH
MICASYPLALRWYLVRTERHRERAAAEAIGELALETYLPIETHFARHGRKVRTVSAPLFRGYLFTRFDLERDDWPQIRRAHGVVDLICSNEVPLRVPERELEVIRTAEGAGLYDTTRQPVAPDPFPRGAKVRITGGPFEGRLATVARLAPQRRIEILFEMLNRGVRLQIERMHLERI